MKQKAGFFPAHAFMKLVYSLPGLILVTMIGITVHCQNMPQTDPSAQHGAASSLTDQAGISEPVQETVIPSGHEPEQEGETSPAATADRQTLNILLIGQDRQKGEKRARSDTMILCTLNKNAKTLTLTSFLRDLYVKIPGYQSNRINAAYAFGGTLLLNQTLYENFGLEVDGNVEVDFAQFTKIVDLLGGVNIELRHDEAAVINRDTGSSLSEGMQTLNGKQALLYSRIRKLDADGDFSRTGRQRKIMEAMLQSCKNASLTTLISLIRQIFPMINTDMGTKEILMHVLELAPILSELQIITQHIPASGTYTNQSINGMSVLVADMDKARRLLEQTLSGSE